jgi:iron complex outermembrane receptor protein
MASAVAAVLRDMDSKRSAGQAHLARYFQSFQGISRISYSALMATLGALALPMAVHAQSSNAAGDAVTVPDVKVTAERRETSLQKTPVAVNSISADEIDQRGLRRLGDLNGLAAGVSTPTSSYNGTTAVFIRGIGTSRPIGNPSVGLYLDDVYIPRAFGGGFYGSLPDLERIEILHGPQGTLYGQNTSAGAVKFISLQPGDQKQAWVSVAAGNHNAVEARGYATAPIAPGLLSASVAYQHDQKGGEIHNYTTNSDVGITRNDQLRTIFRLTPSADFDATLSIDAMQFKQDYVLSPDPRFRPGAGRDAYAYVNPTQDYQGGGLSLKLNARLDPNLSLRSISAWRTFKYTMPTDYDVAPTRIFGFTQDLDQEQLSQEFQLLGDYGRFNFITGLSLYREVFNVDRLSWTNNAYSILKSHNTTSSVGIFGQGNYKITDKLGVTAGLRLNRETKGMDASGYGSNINRAQLAQTFGVNGLEKTYNAATPKLSLDYQWTPDLLTYASWSKGQTSGGFNAAPGNAAVAAIPINTEKVTAYEIGIKDNAWNGRLKTSAAFFYNDYTDYQASITNPVINGVPVTGSVIANAGKAHTYGVELEAAFKPTTRFDGRASLTYLRTKFDEFSNPTGSSATNLNGKELPNAPKLTAAISGTYALPLKEAGVLRVTGAARYQTESYSDITAYRESTKYPSQTFIDAGAAYTTADGAWTLSLSVRNLLNKTYVLPDTYNPSLNLYAVTYNPERQILLGLRRDF